VDYKIIYGDPSKQTIWSDLTPPAQQYQNEDGYMRIASLGLPPMRFECQK
jgi:hypothetical protein